MRVLTLLALAACTPETPPVASPAPEPGPGPGSHPEPPSCDVPDDGGAPGHNVLVVLLDDIGIDGVATYPWHPDPPATPTLDSLAAEGVRFSRAYTTPLCSPARALLLTGRYGRRYGFGNNPVPDSATGLPTDEHTIADLVRAAPEPYATAVFGKWHLSGLGLPGIETMPAALGFEHFDTTVANLESELVDDGQPNDYYHWERDDNGVLSHVDAYNPTFTVDRALEWLADAPEPWLVYLPLHSAHGPNHVPPWSLHSTGVNSESPDPDLFAAMVEAGDAELGRLLDGLPADVRARTTIIAAGDNGTKLGNVREPWDLPGGKGSFADGGLHVPLIVAGPLVRAPGAVSDALVHFVDILPTVADAACVDPGLLVDEDGAPIELDGISLAPLLRDPTDPGERDYVYVEQLGLPGAPPYGAVDKRAVLTWDYKLVVDINAGTEELTAIGESPEDESDDLLLDDPDGVWAGIAAALRAQLDAHWASLPYEGDGGS